MRAFLAIDVNNKEIIERLNEVQKKISFTGADVKHVEPENLHFTIKFFGEIGEDQVKQIWNRLNDLSFAPIHLNYEGIGTFPSTSKISVIWVGVSREGGERLISIAKTVKDRLKTLSVGDERPFQPHLTITRVRSNRNKDKLIEVINNLQTFLFGNDTLTSLKMKTSILTPKGSIYTDIYTLPFKEET